MGQTVLYSTASPQYDVTSCPHLHRRRGNRHSQIFCHQCLQLHCGDAGFGIAETFSLLLILFHSHSRCPANNRVPNGVYQMGKEKGTKYRLKGVCFLLFSTRQNLCTDPHRQCVCTHTRMCAPMA